MILWYICYFCYIEHTYWSKDIIFLFTQHEFVGIQAWLDEYLQVTTSSCELFANLIFCVMYNYHDNMEVRLHKHVIYWLIVIYVCKSAWIINYVM